MPVQHNANGTAAGVFNEFFFYIIIQNVFRVPWTSSIHRRMQAGTRTTTATMENGMKSGDNYYDKIGKRVLCHVNYTTTLNTQTTPNSSQKLVKNSKTRSIQLLSKQLLTIILLATGVDLKKS